MLGCCLKKYTLEFNNKTVREKLNLTKRKIEIIESLMSKSMEDGNFHKNERHYEAALEILQQEMSDIGIEMDAAKNN